MSKSFSAKINSRKNNKNNLKSSFNCRSVKAETYNFEQCFPNINIRRGSLLITDLPLTSSATLSNKTLNHFMNELITKVFVEQPRLHRWASLILAFALLP